MHASPSYVQALSNRPKKAEKKELDHIRIHSAENGGHIVEHHFSSNGMGYHEPEQHVFGDGEGKELMAHLAKYMKIHAGSKEQAKEEQAEE